MARKEALPEGMDRQSGSLRVRVRVIGFEPISATSPPNWAFLLLRTTQVSSCQTSTYV